MYLHDSYNERIIFPWILCAVMQTRSLNQLLLPKRPVIEFYPEIWSLSIRTLDAFCFT